MTSESTPGSARRALDRVRPDLWVFDRRSETFRALAEHGPTSEQDRARADRLQDESARTDVLARRSAVRGVLSAYLGRSASKVRIVTLPGGKPTLVPETGDDVAPSYSSSQSGDVFCVGVGATSSLGVDVELLRPILRAPAIADRWFSRAEVASLAEWGTDESSEGFLRLWTGKEALAKRHAAGLRLMTRRVDELDVLAEVDAGRLRHVTPRPGYLAAVAGTTTLEGVQVVSATDVERVLSDSILGSGLKSE